MPSRYKEVFDNAREFIGVLDTDGTLLEVNKTALNFGGLDHDDVVGKKFWDTDWLEFSDVVQSQVREDIRRAVEGEHIRHGLEVQGEEEAITIDFSLKPLINNEGDVTRLLAEGHRISQLKQQETIDQQIREELPQSNLLISYSRTGEETVSEAVLHAFLAANTDIFEKETTLQDWINTDALDTFNWDQNSPHILTTTIWGHNVGISVDEIRIYSKYH